MISLSQRFPLLLSVGSSCPGLVVRPGVSSSNGRKLEAVTSDRERNQANVAADLDVRSGKRQRVAHQFQVDLEIHHNRAGALYEAP